MTHDRGQESCSPGIESIHHAAECGVVDALKRLLADGADPDERTTFTEQTALMHARTVEVVGVLLEAGADLRALDHAENDALQCALEGDHFASDDPDHDGFAERARVADALVKAGADLARARGAEESRMFSAVYGAHAEGVRYLIERGVRCDEVDGSGATLLHRLCWQGVSERG